MKGTDGRSMKDFYGLQEGIVGYFGVGIKYDAAPSKKDRRLYKKRKLLP